MQKPVQLTTFAYFVFDNGTTSSRTSKPSFPESANLGNAVSISYTPDDGEEVIQKPGPESGVFEDHTIFKTQETETFTLTVNELTDTALKLLRHTDAAVGGGSASFNPGVPGTAGKVIGIGWLRVLHKDERGLAIEQVDRYCHLNITNQTMQKGVMPIALNGRRLSSTLNHGDWTNLT